MALATTGITTSLVGSTLGTTSRSVSTLCTHSNINKWSKKKPVEINNPAPSRSGAWYQGDNGCCGFKQDSIYFGTSAANLIAAYQAGTTYQYQPPTGYKRLADFGGYEHNAKNPCWSINVMGMIYNNSSSSFIEVSVDWNNDVNTSTNLMLTDLVPQNLVDVNECYFGIIVIRNGTYYYKTSSTKVSEINTGDPYYVRLYQTEFSTVGTHTVYPALFSLPVTTFGSSGGGVRFVAIPQGTSGTWQSTFTVKNNSMEGSIAWMGAWYSQAAKLTIGGTLAYKKSYEGSSISLVFYKTVNGTRQSVGNRTVTLSHTGTNGTDFYTMDFEYMFTQATQANTIYYIDATLSTYTVTTQCDEGNPLE